MDDSLLGQQIPIAFIASEVIEWLKKQSWFPFANVDGPKLNKMFAGLVAMATGLGLHFAFDASSGTMTITGLNASSILHSVWWAVQQYALQHVYYKSAIQKQEVVVSNKEVEGGGIIMLEPERPKV